MDIRNLKCTSVSTGFALMPGAPGQKAAGKTVCERVIERIEERSSNQAMNRHVY